MDGRPKRTTPSYPFVISRGGGEIDQNGFTFQGFRPPIPKVPVRPGGAGGGWGTDPVTDDSTTITHPPPQPKHTTPPPTHTHRFPPRWQARRDFSKLVPMRPGLAWSGTLFSASGITWQTRAENHKHPPPQQRTPHH